MFCNKCNTPLFDGAHYCYGCNATFMYPGETQEQASAAARHEYEQYQHFLQYKEFLRMQSQQAVQPAPVSVPEPEPEPEPEQTQPESPALSQLESLAVQPVANDQYSQQSYQQQQQQQDQLLKQQMQMQQQMLMQQQQQLEQQRIAQEQALQAQQQAMLAQQQNQVLEAHVHQQSSLACPNCGSHNVSVQMVEQGQMTTKKGVGFGGHVNNAARMTTAVMTLGVSNLVWKKSEGTMKTNTVTATMGVCQTCGNTWIIDNRDNGGNKKKLGRAKGSIFK